MPLSAVGIVPGGVIRAAHITQLINLFTGAMTDQPVTFANTLTVGGSQSVGSVPLRASSVALGTAEVLEIRTLQGDTQPVFSISRLGVLSFGPGGGAATDTTLSRVSAGNFGFSGLTVSTSGITISAGGLTVTGNIGVNRAISASIGVAEGSTALTGTTQIGIQAGLSGSSAATAEVTGIRVNMSTAAAAFTATLVTGIHVLNPATGSGSTVTAKYGILIDGISGAAVGAGAAATNVYGLFITSSNAGTGVNANLAFSLTPTGGTVNTSILFPSVTTAVSAMQWTDNGAGITRIMVAAVGGVPSANTISIQPGTGTTGGSFATVTFRGDGTTLFGGPIGIGGVVLMNAAVETSGLTMSGNATQTTFLGRATANSAATSLNVAFYAQPVSQAVAFTCTDTVGFFASSPIKGAGSTMTNVYGVKVAAQASGNTNNYGVYIDAPSGGSGQNIGLLNNGSGILNGSGTALGFFGGTGAVKAAPTGSRGGNAALASLLTALASYGLITDSTSA